MIRDIQGYREEGNLVEIFDSPPRKQISQKQRREVKATQQGKPSFPSSTGMKQRYVCMYSSSKKNPLLPKTHASSSIRMQICTYNKQAHR